MADNTRMSPRRKRFIGALIGVLALSGAGAAFAYWTSMGDGAGEATTGESVAFTISADDAVGTLSPGGAGQTVEFTVTNPGPGVQYLTAVTVSLAGPTGVAWAPTGDCDVADYTASVTTAPTYGAMTAAGTVTGTATVTLTSTAENQDDCQGQTVPLYFVAS